MYEFEIKNINTNDTRIIFGYTLSDAFRRNPDLDDSEWECIDIEYID